jgi:hypothetical protein
MQWEIWERALARCADPARAREGLEKLRTTSAATALKRATAEQARILAALLSGSQVLSESLIAHPDWLSVASDPDYLRRPRKEQGLRRELTDRLRRLLAAREYAGALAAVRQFKQREMLRVAVRDLARLGSGAEITEEISNVADVCLDAVYQICRRQLTERLGEPYHCDLNDRWQPTTFCVLGLGKLGGQDLNYSSDIDVMFVYAEEGEVFKEKPRRGDEPGHRIPNHQFFRRLAEAIVAEVGRVTPDGMLFRIDLRLRPEGKAGPWARSLSSCENYYAQWGQTWERMMLIKARGVAGDAVLAAELGTMRVTEQIDALRTLATHPIDYLVVPRLLATTLVMPLLTSEAIALGIGAGYLVGVHLLKIDPTYLWTNMLRYTAVEDVIMGLIKTLIFGVVVAMIGCYKGLHCRDGAEGVGRATTEAVVYASITVLVSNFFLTLTLNRLLQ